MNSFEFLPHVADVRILLKADTLEELFRSGMLSISEVLKPGFCDHESKSQITKVIKIQSLDRTMLLVDFLSDILTYSHTEQAIFCDVQFEILKPKHLRAVIKGHHVDSFEEDIKAVTYHEANIKENPDVGLETMIIIDI